MVDIKEIHQAVRIALEQEEREGPSKKSELEESVE